LVSIGCRVWDTDFGSKMTVRGESRAVVRADLAVAQILAASAAEESLYPRLLEAIGGALGLDFGAWWEHSDRGETLRCIDTWRSGSLRDDDFASLTRRTEFARGVGLPGRVWATGEPAWIADLSEDPNFPRAAGAALAGLRSGFAFPVRSAGGGLGAIEMFASSVHEPDRELLETMASLGSQLGQLIARRRAEHEVRESNERRRAILEAALDCVITIDGRGRVLEFNPAAERTFGYSRAEAIGRDLAELIIPPALRVRHREGFSRLLATGEPRALDRRLELTGMRADGSEFPVELTITRIHLPGPPMFTGYLRDITERRRDTELLRSRAAQQSALAELGLLALGGGPLQAVLEHSTLLVADTLDVELTDVLELDVDADCLRLRAGVGLRAGLVGKVTVPTGRGSRSGFAVARKEPVVVEDLRTETRFRPPPFLLEHGVVSGLTVVIHGRDRQRGAAPWGVLGAHTRAPRAFTEEDINFLHTVANTLGLAIERNDAENELRQRNREIAKLAEQVSRLADDRRRIMADALDAEDRTREQISQLLHDEVLQSLLTARQDLAKLKPTGGAKDDVASQAREAIVSAISELRNAVVALHPVTLEQGGLAAAIEAIADLHANRSGFQVSLNVEPRASGGLRDQLIVSLAQELFSNVAQHAQASHVTITLRRARKGIVFEVIDDGRGMTPARPREALDRGHVGLASIAMRVESLGGSFELTSSPGQGTRVCSVIPVKAPDAPAGSAPGPHPATG
jgi:PAS domain S-box-containing protein